MVNKLVHLDADSETTKEFSVVPNDFSLYVGKPLTDAIKNFQHLRIISSLERVLDFQSILNMERNGHLIHLGWIIIIGWYILLQKMEHIVNFVYYSEQLQNTTLQRLTIW